MAYDLEYRLDSGGRENPGNRTGLTVGACSRTVDTERATGRFLTYIIVRTCWTARSASVIEERWSMIPDKSEFANAIRPKGL